MADKQEPGASSCQLLLFLPGGLGLAVGCDRVPWFWGILHWGSACKADTLISLSFLPGQKILSNLHLKSCHQTFQVVGPSHSKIIWLIFSEIFVSANEQFKYSYKVQSLFFIEERFRGLEKWYCRQDAYLALGRLGFNPQCPVKVPCNHQGLHVCTGKQRLKAELPNFWSSRGKN